MCDMLVCGHAIQILWKICVAHPFTYNEITENKIEEEKQSKTYECVCVCVYTSGIHLNVFKTCEHYWNR